MTILVEVLRWLAMIFGVLFLILLARVNAQAEARSRRELFMKLLNLLATPLMIAVFATLLRADVRRVYYPPGTPEWLTVWPAYQVTSFLTFEIYLFALFVYLISLGFLVRDLRKHQRQEGNERGIEQGI
jgi:uncharacterized membrane protein